MPLASNIAGSRPFLSHLTSPQGKYYVCLYVGILLWIVINSAGLEVFVELPVRPEASRDHADNGE